MKKGENIDHHSLVFYPVFLSPFCLPPNNWFSKMETSGVSIIRKHETKSSPRDRGEKKSSSWPSRGYLLPPSLPTENFQTRELKNEEKRVKNEPVCPRLFISRVYWGLRTSLESRKEVKEPCSSPVFILAFSLFPQLPTCVIKRVDSRCIFSGLCSIFSGGEEKNRLRLVLQKGFQLALFAPERPKTKRPLKGH